MEGGKEWQAPATTFFLTMPELCLLTVHAHPDDEASKGAGTVARYAAEGVRTVLVTCTDGAAGEILNPAAEHPQTRADFDAALPRYEARLDKGYSLTDCRSMLAMRSLGLTEVLTNDHHFTQEGFTILFP